MSPTPPKTPDTKVLAFASGDQRVLLCLPMVTPRHVPSVQLFLQMADLSITLGPTCGSALCPQRKYRALT